MPWSQHEPNSTSNDARPPPSTHAEIEARQCLEANEMEYDAIEISLTCVGPTIVFLPREVMWSVRSHVAVTRRSVGVGIDRLYCIISLHP